MELSFREALIRRYKLAPDLTDAEIQAAAELYAADVAAEQAEREAMAAELADRSRWVPRQDFAALVIERDRIVAARKSAAAQTMRIKAAARSVALEAERRKATRGSFAANAARRIARRVRGQ